MAEENLLKMAEQKFKSAAEKIAKDLIATCYNEQPTNADRIRAMSDEELAETLIQYDDFCGVYMADDGMKYYDFEAAKEAELEWLKQPAE